MWKVVEAVDEGVLSQVRAGLKSVKVPGFGDRVRKAECVLSFDSPESPAGLFVSLTDFQGFGADFVALNSERTGAKLYLNIRWKKIPKPTPPPEEVAAPTKLAIGVEGGFNVDDEQFEFEKTNYLAVFPEMHLIPVPNADLPELIGMSIDAILKASDLSADEAQVMAWEEKRQVSKYADSLVQLDNGIKISPDPSTWACADSGYKENLWLNLSDGYIGSGRRQVDGTGQLGGGTGAALKHYQEERAKGNNFCLCVKLGTITPSGADVYSYAEDEDDMVEDPHLAKHLAHWGINMMQMEKTEKSMAELQIDLNVKFDFDRICESGKQLVTLSGPGFVGLKNLGNSCYMNSVLQVLFTLPELKHRYLDGAAEIFKAAPIGRAPEDFRTQMAKLATGLLTEKYCPKMEPGAEGGGGCVSPQMFKFLVGKGHPEFSTGNQQDAHEYIGHFFEVMDKADRAAGVPLLTDAFTLETEDRVTDLQSGKVRYASSKAQGLSLAIPMEAAVNAAEVIDYQERENKRQRSGPSEDDKETPVKPKIPLEACIQSFCSDTVIGDYISPITKAKGQAAKTTRFKTCPKYLAVHLQRYGLTEDWKPKKLECMVPAPDTLDLSPFMSKGPQPGEDLMPEDAVAAAAPAAAPAAPVPDPTVVAALMQFGMASENGCKRAALATNNQGPDAAAAWMFEHMNDADFNDPIAAPGGAPAPGVAIDEAAVAQVAEMGFPPAHAAKALRHTGGSVERAIEWLFNNAGNMDAMDVDEPAPAAPAAPAQASEAVAYEPKYTLVGFISHIGPSTACGHYVCHIKKDGKWTIFNDRKVALSEDPPFDLGFVYLYQSVGPKSA